MLSTKTIFGAGWLVSSRLMGRMIDFFTVLILARALTPADFGLTALGMSLIAIVDTALEVPLSQALTRLKTLDKSHLDTAFTLGLLRGGLLSLVLLSAAWPFALIYHDTRLTALVCLLAAGPISRSLYSPAMVKFVRLISFRQAFVAELIGKIIASATAISLAHFGAGYWAIAANGAISSLATTLLSYIIAPYLPAISLANIVEFSSFLGWFSSAQILAATSWQMDRGLLGFFVSKSTLGKYTMASDLAVMPTQSLVGPAMQPIMAAFSRISDDNERLVKAYLKASHFTMTLAMPTCLGMALTADLIVKVLLGPRWGASATYLQWLAVAMALNAFYPPLYSLAMAINKPLIIFKICLAELVCKFIFILAGFYLYSLMGVVVARGVVAGIIFIAVMLTTKKLLKISAARQLSGLWWPLVSCGVMVLAILIIRPELAAYHLAPYLELGLVAASGAGIYGATLFATGFRFRL